jgi:hypothetical protein
VLIFICAIQTYFQVKTELKVIGHMSDPNSTSPDILSDGPVKDILRPVDGLKKFGRFNGVAVLTGFHCIIWFESQSKHVSCASVASV